MGMGNGWDAWVMMDEGMGFVNKSIPDLRMIACGGFDE
jgi:hypothetical protein